MEQRSRTNQSDGIVYTEASSIKFKTDNEVLRDMIKELERRIKNVEEVVRSLKCLKKDG